MEELVIIKTNTVTNPWTMMVHPHNTSITYRTMMSPWWLNRFTFETVSISDNSNHITVKLCIHRFLYFLPLFISHLIVINLSLFLNCWFALIIYYILFLVDWNLIIFLSFISWTKIITFLIFNIICLD